ncbi:unnamed protein product [Lupinus luteus]|uniref:Uncharacterized protein n=1 Tax=Lupinus luteus TaxID=3873 RepID=A0AAV1WJI8_LUPLU
MEDSDQSKPPDSAQLSRQPQIGCQSPIHATGKPGRLYLLQHGRSSRRGGWKRRRSLAAPGAYRSQPSPGSGDELSDFVAELDQVEREIRRLSESRIESTEGLEARQTKLARIKMVLDGVESRSDQAREIDRVRHNERARLREEMDYDYHRWGTLEQENA